MTTRRAAVSVLVASALLQACATGPKSRRAPAPPVPAVQIQRAEAALASEEGARAIALYRRYLDRKDIGAPQRARALGGLARAHELLQDHESAVNAYAAALELKGRPAPDRIDWLARKGANEAEIERWAASAESFAQAEGIAGPGALPSQRVEFLARRAYALFGAGDLPACVETIDRGEAIYKAALEADTERFSTFYFVGMLRFYRGAALHAQFRAIEVALPETQMAKDFEAKLALLVKAQEAYNATIATKHIYWVSAAGFQLGHLFEEFYDTLMHAPVPEWLDERQRRVYYEELKEQLRPVVNKAIWVFERNLEAARRLGYETEFTEQSEAALARLQSILLSGDTALGDPHPQLAPIAGDSGGQPAARGDLELSASQRKVFLPAPTPL